MARSFLLWFLIQLLPLHLFLPCFSPAFPFPCLCPPPWSPLPAIWSHHLSPPLCSLQLPPVLPAGAPALANLEWSFYSIRKAWKWERDTAKLRHKSKQVEGFAARTHTIKNQSLEAETQTQIFWSLMLQTHTLLSLQQCSVLHVTSWAVDLLWLCKMAGNHPRALPLLLQGVLQLTGTTNLPQICGGIPFLPCSSRRSFTFSLCVSFSSLSFCSHQHLCFRQNWPPLLKPQGKPCWGQAVVPQLSRQEGRNAEEEESDSTSWAAVAPGHLQRFPRGTGDAAGLELGEGCKSHLQGSFCKVAGVEGSTKTVEVDAPLCKT